jgi:hypothetical protein
LSCFAARSAARAVTATRWRPVGGVLYFYFYILCGRFATRHNWRIVGSHKTHGSHGMTSPSREEQPRTASLDSEAKIRLTAQLPVSRQKSVNFEPAGYPLRDLEKIDKSPPKCLQTRDPDLRGQIPKRSCFLRFHFHSHCEVLSTAFCVPKRPATY